MGESIAHPSVFPLLIDFHSKPTQFQNRRNRTKKEGKMLRKKPIYEVTIKPLDKLYKGMKGHMIDSSSQASKPSKSSSLNKTTEVGSLSTIPQIMTDGNRTEYHVKGCVRITFAAPCLSVVLPACLLLRPIPLQK